MRSKKHNPEKIGEIKKVLKHNASKGNTIRDAARTCEVSYYTAWCVANGKYDEGRLQMYESKLCPITGFKL